jgi:hypothetical protein
MKRIEAYTELKHGVYVALEKNLKICNKNLATNSNYVHAEKVNQTAK